MKKKALVVLTVLAVLGGGLTLAAAHGTRADHAAPDGMMGRMGGMMGSGTDMMGGNPMMSHMSEMGMRSGHGSAERPWLTMALHHREKLGLSADQTKTLESLRSEFEKQAIRQSAEIQVAETELADLLRAEPVDLAKVEAKLRQLESARTDLRLARIKTLAEGKAALTPEQRKKLESLGSRAPHGPRGRMGSQGVEDMQRFMQSERMPQAMSGMMEMARQMGNGDAMAGMVRMMEMMGMMGQRGGSIEPSHPESSR